MCGICGEVRFDGQRADRDATERMTDAMIRRGPDSGGIADVGQRAVFGHRRLCIIDLSERGSQPMVDKTLGLTMVFNGCIYNYKQLRDELIGYGYRFFSTADSEVVLKGYAHWGRDCVQHFVGMFAFAVLEHDSGVLTLGRDRLGIKPLYYSETGGRLRFASTLQALLAAGDVDKTLDRVALNHYFSFHSVVPAPRTMYAGIRKLPPATVRQYQPDGSFRDETYWSPSFERDSDQSSWNAEDWEDAIMASLRTAVVRRMVSDVPVGVLLSGGIDSSVLVALLAEQGQQGLKTFSIGFDSAAGESGDEYFYSDLVAQTFNTDHQQIHIDTARLVPAIPKTIAAMSEPMVSHDCVAFYLLSEEVSKSIKVVQSGQGADEILGGYSWYPPLADVDRDAVTPAYVSQFVDRSYDEIAALLSAEFMHSDDVSLAFVTEHQGTEGASTAVDAALRLDTTVMLVDDPVKRVDNMTMSWGLEGRVPFLDHDFVELAGKCPPHHKLACGGKGVLKNASRKLLPVEVIDRRKGYFPVPGIRHLEGEVLDMVRDALGSRAAKERGLYQQSALDRLFSDPNGIRTTLGSNALWQVGLLEMWLQGH